MAASKQFQAFVSLLVAFNAPPLLPCKLPHGCMTSMSMQQEMGQSMRCLVAKLRAQCRCCYGRMRAYPTLIVFTPTFTSSGKNTNT